MNPIFDELAKKYGYVEPPKFTSIYKHGMLLRIWR